MRYFANRQSVTFVEFLPFLFGMIALAWLPFIKLKVNQL